MYIDDTIAAISTPPGQGGIGIVRISGKDAILMADKIFYSPKKKKLIKSPTHRMHYGFILDPSDEEIVDEVLVSVMKSPNTYTREDIIEINCHGGAVPLRRILEIALQEGARLAEPGEFTRRAFINGRIDLAQAEAVLDVINSLTIQSQKSSMNQLRGTLSKKIDSIRDKLIELTAFVEAHIDFPEDDISSLSSTEMKEMAINILNSIKKLIESARFGVVLREGVKTAIAGRPNVGKSSLLNALLEQDRAIVTEIPGTTRDVIEEHLNIQGIPVRIMDTAGIRDVRDIAEQEGVKRSVRTIDEADLVLLILDGSEPLHATDERLIERSKSKNGLILINKTDLPQKINIKKYNGKIVYISAKTGEGLKELRNEMVEAILGGKIEYGPEIVTNIRHVHALGRANESLNKFITGIRNQISPEFLSIELREALDSIGEIQGVTTTDDILNKIFDSFCIGK